MKKALVVATACGFLASFEISNIKLLQKLGYEVHCATNFETINDVQKRERLLNCGIIPHQMSFFRNPLNTKNIVAIKSLKKLMKDKKFDIVHCHTPVVSACTRWVCKKQRKNETTVIYTAHGFHFFKGAPLKNWLIFYPIEWMCSHWTDVLITINTEDYTFAQKKMKAKKIVHVPGVGIDLEKFDRVTVDKKTKRVELGIPKNAILLLSVGELNDNKNHETVIRAIASMDVYYIIAGQGDKKEQLEEVTAKVGMADRVKLLGYRADVNELYAVSDLFVFPSFREGLSVSLMEAMAMGLPCAVSKIRGNIDLIDDGGGVLFNPASIEECKTKIKQLLSADRTTMGVYNSKKIKNFDMKTVVEQIKDIYDSSAKTPTTAKNS